MVEVTTGKPKRKVVNKEELVKREHRSAAMKPFVNSPGWLEMVAYFKGEIDKHTKLLVGMSKKAVTTNDLHFLRDNGLVIDLYNKIIELPEIWIIEKGEK